MGLFWRNNTLWYEFVFGGKRIRGSSNSSSKTVAVEAEKKHRLRLERARVGLPTEEPSSLIRSVSEVVEVYLRDYELGHAEESISSSQRCLANVKRLLGRHLLPDLTEDVVREYMRDRLNEEVVGRTINMELGELSRALGYKWSVLWPKIRKLKERSNIGKALSPEEETAILHALNGSGSPNRSQLIGAVVRIALLTGMRSGEIVGLTWGQVDFTDKVIKVGRAKTAAGSGRPIPMNSDLHSVLMAHTEWFAHRFGAAKPSHFLFPFGKPTPSDPTQRITDISSAWDSVRKRAGVDCRFHDLRHTVATKLAEIGTPESTMMALLGHMSRQMLEHYSHIRMAAKRTAMNGISLRPMETLTLPSGNALFGPVTKSPTTACA